jgi:2-aminoethylphosphonate-pyruvate transaminase
MNDIKALGEIAQKHKVQFIVDAMSSFGGIEIDMKACGIDYLVSSANKCIQGVPGFSFAIAKRSLLEQCEGRARSLSLDLYDQWKNMEVDGKWRYTSPTHVVLAFAQALKELEEEGGIVAREARYSKSQSLLVKRMKKIGFEPYIDESLHSPIITTFLYPDASDGKEGGEPFDFQDMYDFMKLGGFVIYPGKLTEVDTFRIGNIGEIYKEDINELCDLLTDYARAR